MTEISEWIYDADPEDISVKLIGRRVVSIDTHANVITLDDGTTLDFRDTSDCCAWFSAELKAGNLTQNIVTNVVEENPDPQHSDGFTLHIFAADDLVGTIAVDGSEGSGYYCHSIDVLVIEPIK